MEVTNNWQFDNTIKNRYYELDETERLENKIMYNQIIRKLKYGIY